MPMEGEDLGTGAANLRWAHALIANLYRGGLRQVVVSPGSRSTPLVWAADEHPGIAITIQIDERSAAFFALGAAKGSRLPVAAICTSGTAAANFFPAVVEASLAAVPLVLLTADRPPEIRGTGAPQTCDQVRLYGNHVRYFRDLPCPRGDIGIADLDEMFDAAGTVVQAALRAALGMPPGPVHLNVPFREPLIPSIPDLDRADVTTIHERIDPAPNSGSSTEALIPPLVERIQHARRPLIVAGVEAADPSETGPIFRFALRSGIPILADVASGLRFAGGDHGALLLSHADIFLRDEEIASRSADLVLRLGGLPTSKAICGWLARHRPTVIAIQNDSLRRDPDGIVSETIVAPAGPLLDILGDRCRDPGRDSAWQSGLRDAEARAEELCAQAPIEALAVREVCAALPRGASIFLSNSMPIRWAEAYASPTASAARVFVNRGVNGIDGIISTAIGASVGSDTPLLLVIGDLAFLHDLGGLRLAAALRRPLAILLLNNDGGGIFSHLPIAEHRAIFDPLFGTPHGADLASAARSYRIPHIQAGTPKEAASLVRETLESEGVRVIEVRTDRDTTAHQHARLVEKAMTRRWAGRADDLLWESREMGREGAPAVLFLHGFGGTGAFWGPVAQRLHGLRRIFPDLPGHGGTHSPTPPEAWRMERAAGELVSLLDQIKVERCALVGYSMGGRLALHASIRFPERFSHLALFSASPGLSSPAERRARAAADLDLADSIVRDGIEAFAERWESLPMFATQRDLPTPIRQSMQKMRRAQDPVRLADALRAFGTAFQDPLQDRLGELRIPVLIVAGARDEKYTRTAQEMAIRIPGSVCRILVEAGHAVPLERPGACAAMIVQLLKGADAE